MAHHITQQQVVAWTRKFKNDKVIGKVASGRSCPFANYLKDVYGMNVVVVGPCGYTYRSKKYGIVKKDIPKWASEAIMAIDWAREWQSPLTVREFKDILKGVGVEI